MKAFLGVLFILLGFSSMGADGGEPAEKVLKDLSAKAADAKTDHAKLRSEVVEFRRAFAGTPSALKAADLLRRLPSPLDALDPARIDPEERKVFPKELTASVFGHNRATASVAISPDGSLLASTGWDNTTRLWKLGGKLPKEWATLKGSPSGLAFSPDGKTLAAGNAETSVILWDVTGEKPRQKATLHGHKNRPFAMTFSPTGKMFASGCFDPVLRVWKMGEEIEQWAALANEKVPSLGISSLAFSPDGKLLAAGALLGESSLRLWNASGDFLDERDIPKTQARLVAFSPDGKTLAFHGGDPAIHRWNLSDPAKPKALDDLVGHADKGNAQAILALAFATDGRILASFGKDKKLILWEMPSGKKLRDWDFPGEVRALDWASDGRHLAAAFEDGSVLVFRIFNLP